MQLGLQLADIACMSGGSGDYADYLHARRVVRKPGFPKPIAVIGVSRLWEPSAVRHWFANNKPTRRKKG
jgi:hypothetical protein